MAQRYKALNVEDILSTAMVRTGLSDFGPPDFRQAFEVLIDGINKEARIRPESVASLHDRFVNLLVQRLRFAKDLADHPEIMNEDLGSPVLIFSLPRSGSTKLHRMLGATGDFQTLRLWTTLKFARIPDLEDGGRALRIQETREFEAWMYSVSPDMLTGHPMHTEEPEEEGYLLECTFRHAYIGGMFDTPSYMQWLSQENLAPTYEYLIAVLKYLQWQTPGERHLPWLLKDPTHIGSEDRLCQMYSKPKFIMVHRDPTKCIPSTVNTVMATRRLYSDLDNSNMFGDAMVEGLSSMMNDHMAWRDRHPEVQILDLSFREVVEDARGAANKVYAFLGKPFTATAAEGLSGWELRNPQHKHGKPRYSSEAIGTTDDAIREAFAPYVHRFAPYL